MKDDLYRWIGAILIGLGIFFDMIGILGATVINEEMESPPESYWGIVGLCTVVFLLPGIAIFAWGYKLGKKESELEKLVGYLKSYRRIKTSDVARKLGKTEYETEQLIIKCVELNLIKGYFDRSSGEFFTYESMFEEVQRPDKCPNCGASMFTRVLSGESAVCNYCGARFTPHPLSRPIPPPPAQYYAGQPYSPTPQPRQYQPPLSSYPQQIPPPLMDVTKMMSVKCPNCKKVFDVQRQAGHFRITCPYCNTEGMMG